MTKKNDLPSLMKRVLEFRASAMPIEESGFRVYKAEYNGLAILFKDAVRMPPQPHLPPLTVTIYNKGKTVFIGAVDPDNPAHSTHSKWEGRDWEKHLNPAPMPTEEHHKRLSELMQKAGQETGGDVARSAALLTQWVLEIDEPSLWMALQERMLSDMRPPN